MPEFLTESNGTEFHENFLRTLRNRQVLLLILLPAFSCRFHVDGFVCFISSFKFGQIITTETVFPSSI